MIDGGVIEVAVDGAAPIRDGQCRVVAEAGQCMTGDPTIAIRMAAAAAKAGAWAFKTQVLTPELIAAADAPKYWVDDFGTTNQRDAFELAGVVDPGAWREVRDACADYRIVFTATPFDHDAVDLLADLDVPVVKVASGDITNLPLLRHIGMLGVPVLLSTGASHQHEVESAVASLTADGALRIRNIILLACTLAYPTPDWEAHLARIPRLAASNPLQLVGYSDHTIGTDTALAAAAMGACVLEKHYTWDRVGPVADKAMAVDPDQLARYVAAANRGAALRGSGVLAPVGVEEQARVGARRSLFWRGSRPAGEAVSLAHVVALRPAGRGLEPGTDLRGRRLARDVSAGDPVRVEDFE